MPLKGIDLSSDSLIGWKIRVSLPSFILTPKAPATSQQSSYSRLLDLTDQSVPGLTTRKPTGQCRDMDTGMLETKHQQSTKSLHQEFSRTVKMTLEADSRPIAQVTIKSGIYQGEALSPLLFCIGLNPLRQIISRRKGIDCSRVRRIYWKIVSCSIAPLLSSQGTKPNNHNMLTKKR